MNDFTATLAEFRAGRCEFAELEAAFGRLVGASPTEIDAALALVDEHYRAGHFPTQLYAVLRSRAKAAEASDAGKTRLRPADAAQADAGKTRLRPAVPAARADDGRTRLRPQRPEAADAPPSTPTTGTRDALWREGAAGAEDVPDVAPGFVLKGRFVLEQEVGRGGMGVVFRARDLRKEEAQDRDPFVAIKILNDEFRRHPESLKALQREARKAQNLAHPNIATVFDFDRDGAIVYIQMEFLHGRPLDAVIRESGGMPYREAYPLIAGMGRALSYAHGLGIVHSDFKPGNCFATANEVVKVFDFGIARAAKIQGAARDELTRFDAGTLGALTPAYASCEMLDGMEPDPRDDIYALGCVAYELLTGKHPFGKLPATEARAKKLTPPVVKGVTPRQQRALQRTLAFRREDRTRTVAEFLEAVGEYKLNKMQVATGVVAAVAVAGVGFTLVQGFLQERRTEALVTDLGSGTPERVEPALEALDALDAAQQTTVLQAAREPLVTYFVELVDAAFDPDGQRYDYAAADAVLAKARALITDSDGLG
ncbi:MAG TPA: serine/threonine-protein kinase, partial [Gammaproteobacteria bacterium]